MGKIVNKGGMTGLVECDIVDENEQPVAKKPVLLAIFNCYHKTRVVSREIEARSFGYLEKTAVHDIWNSPDFMAFWEEVRLYAFSNCSNCNVAPCDFILGPDFEKDCSVATVPCGDCFWCMGMFNCLQ